jgi:hypothetical protein
VLSAGPAPQGCRASFGRPVQYLCELPKWRESSAFKPIRYVARHGRCGTVGDKPVNIAVVRKSQAGFGNTIRKPRIRMDRMAKPMTKSELISQIAEHSELKKSDVKGVMETLATIGYKELKKNGSFVALPDRK